MKRSDIRKIREGFQGQKQICIPPHIMMNFLSKNSITKQLFITRIGYYPKAGHHHVERAEGSNQHILIYCAEGNGWLKMGDNFTQISSSQFTIIPARVAHSYGAAEKNPWSIYWIHFQGDISDAIVALITQNFKYKNIGVLYNEKRLQLFENMYENLLHGYSHENLQYINMVFYHFLSSLIFETNFRNYDKTEKNIIEKTISHMADNVNELLTLKDFASFANLSVSRFSHLFRNATGYSPIDYFNHLKVQKACQYLLFTDNTVKEIGYKLGINDPYYFSRLFTRTMSVSPKKYRFYNKR